MWHVSRLSRCEWVDGWVAQGLWIGGYLGLVAVGALLLGSIDLAPELTIERCAPHWSP